MRSGKKKKPGNGAEKNGGITKVRYAKIIEEECCFLTLPKQTRRQADEKGGTTSYPCLSSQSEFPVCLETLSRRLGRKRTRGEHTEREEREKG